MGVNTLWESTDGLTWHAVPEPPTLFSIDAVVGAGADGTVVAFDLATSGLSVSYDGRTWTPMKLSGGCDTARGVTLILGPMTPGLGAWVVQDGLRLCTSRDLVSWSGKTMTAAPTTLAQTRFGVIMLGDACYGAGSTCSPDPKAYLWRDGIDWSPLPLPASDRGSAVMDGPAGVLMIGGAKIWRLDR